MRRPLVAGNWKLHGDRALCASLCLAARAAAGSHPAVEVLLLPPVTLLGLAVELTAHTAVRVGAQTCSAHAQGAYTGEVSAALLREAGAEYVLVGHSERRQYFGASDEVIAEQYRRALEAGLIPILCVGEGLDEREHGRTEAVLERQLSAVLERVGVNGIGGGVLAYEPVWAIGTGRTASPQQAQQAHAFLRSQIAARDASIADSLRILYGGSVKANNAAELLQCTDVDGALVGGASLSAAEFTQIVAAAEPSLA